MEQQLRGVIQQLLEPGRCYSPHVARALAEGRRKADVPAAIYCQHLLYWSNRGRDPQWIYKSVAEIEDETALHKHEQERCRALLERLGILTTEVRTAPTGAGLSPTRHFKVDREKLVALLVAGLTPASPDVDDPDAAARGDARPPNSSDMSGTEAFPDSREMVAVALPESRQMALPESRQMALPESGEVDGGAFPDSREMPYINAEITLAENTNQKPTGSLSVDSVSPPARQDIKNFDGEPAGDVTLSVDIGSDTETVMERLGYVGPRMRPLWPAVLLTPAGRRKDAREITAADFAYPGVARAYRWLKTTWSYKMEICERFLPTLEELLGRLSLLAARDGQRLERVFELYLDEDRREMLPRLQRHGGHGGMAQLIRELIAVERAYRADLPAAAELAGLGSALDLSIPPTAALHGGVDRGDRAEALAS